MDINKLVTLKEFCEAHEVDYKRARRLAKQGQFEGAQNVLGTWAIDKDAEVPELPEAGTHGSTREDGRQRFVVYATNEEIIDIMSLVGDDNVTDPRVAAKARRAARKAEAADGGNDDA